ncbi:osteopontin isoform X2 [Motacilla alba alba]|uniref:osteopontin isoform X2 n=1 Tax=Motacilla alba alba TaxID=1094192 RepID=UPI0018D4F03B|nr:osteopontin isoform X2 [Motacilla alba alba]
MKVTVLCLCLISITAAWPVIQSKQHAISASSKEKNDFRGHHLHRYHNNYVNSQSQESHQLPQSDLASSQETLYPSEESVDVTEQVGDSAGRGDSVAYRMRAKAALLKSIKLHKATKKLIYDTTEEDKSDMDADSQRSISREHSASRRSLRKHTSSVVWSDPSHGRDSSEQDSDPHDQSLENDSRPKSDSRESEGDSSKSDVRGDSLSSVGSRERGDSHPSVESRESRDRVSAGLSDDISSQTLESAEDSQDRHSIESNEVTL